MAKKKSEVEMTRSDYLGKGARRYPTGKYYIAAVSLSLESDGTKRFMFLHVNQGETEVKWMHSKLGAKIFDSIDDAKNFNLHAINNEKVDIDTMCIRERWEVIQIPSGSMPADDIKLLGYPDRDVPTTLAKLYAKDSRGAYTISKLDNNTGCIITAVNKYGNTVFLALGSDTYYWTPHSGHALMFDTIADATSIDFQYNTRKFELIDEASFAETHLPSARIRVASTLQTIETSGEMPQFIKKIYEPFILRHRDDDEMVV